MVYSALADLTVIIHFSFILFVIFGALLVLKWRRVAWLHIPAALYGAAIEFWGWICPLTPLENWLRRQAGQVGYEGSFIAHYLVPIIYPAELTRMFQIILGVIVIVINVVLYWQVMRRR